MKTLLRTMRWALAAAMTLSGCRAEDVPEFAPELTVKTLAASVDETDVLLSGSYSYNGVGNVQLGFRYSRERTLLSEAELIRCEAGGDGRFHTGLKSLENGEYWYEAVAVLDGKETVGADGFFKIDFTLVPTIVTGIADITETGYLVTGQYSFASKRVPIRVGFFYEDSKEALAEAEFVEVAPTEGGELSMTIPFSFGVSCFYQAAAIVEGNVYRGEIKSAGMKNLSADGDANCFMVNEAGWYSFRANRPDGTTVIGDKVDWMWATGTDNGLVSNIRFADGMISFKLEKSVPASIVIGMKNGTNVVWNWHIWVTDAIDQTLGGVTFMDRNLGANNVSANSPESIGLMYQFGRKDPFIGARLMDNSIPTDVYESVPFSLDRSLERSWCADYVVNTDFMPDGFRHEGSEMDEEMAVANPMTYYGKYNAGGWSMGFETVKDFWGGVSKTKKNQDPCPAGYKVSSLSDITAFVNDVLCSSTSGATSVYGKTVEGKSTWGRIYTLGGVQYNWPATGWRAWSGVLSRPGNVIAMTTADATADKKMAIYWNWGNGDNRFCEAFPLRCVRIR